MALTISIEGLGVIANADGTSDSAGGTWAELGAGTLSYTTDVKLFGSGCIAGAYSNKDGWQYYDIGSGSELDFTPSTGSEAGQFVYMWIHCPTLGLIDTLANNGLSIRLGTSLSDYRDYTIAGSNGSNGWNGGWRCFVIDPTKTGSITDTGTYNYASVRYFGVWINTTAIAKGDNIFIDQISVGKGLRITGTSTTPWADAVNYCTDYANRAWGMLQEREGIYYAYGEINWGSSSQGSASSFVETSSPVIQFGVTEYYYSSAWALLHPTTYSKIAIDDAASYATTFDDGVIVGSDNGRSGAVILGDSRLNVSVDLYGGNNSGSLTRLYGTNFKRLTGGITWGNDSDHKFYGGAVIGCGQFDPVGAPQIRNCIFAETYDADSALLWNENIDIQDCNFIANTTGAAIEMPSAVGTPYAYTALFFNGNTYDVYNSSGSAITINKNSLSDPSTYEGSTVSFSASYIFTVTGLELNTEVTIVTSGTTTVLHHTENATTSDGGGKYQISYTHSGGATVDVLIHHVDYKPDISNILALTLPSSNSSSKVSMFADDNYENPT